MDRDRGRGLRDVRGGLEVKSLERGWAQVPGEVAEAAGPGRRTAVLGQRGGLVHKPLFGLMLSALCFQRKPVTATTGTVTSAIRWMGIHGGHQPSLSSPVSEVFAFLGEPAEPVRPVVG